jgi:hypothetical protein
MGISIKQYKQYYYSDSIFFWTLFGFFFAGVAFGAMPKTKEPSQLMKSTSSAVQSGVWVMRSDNAQSCEPKSGTSLKDDAEELKKAQIPILDSKKGSDGKFHIQMCGADKGTTNSFLIPKDKLPVALAMGYREVPPVQLPR